MIYRINLKEIEERLDLLRSKAELQLENDLPQVNGNIFLFLSVGNKKVRAKVFQASGQTIDKAWRKIKQTVLKFIQKSNMNPEWLKIDFVTKIEQWDFVTFEQYIAKERRNYFRKGLAFDSEFRLAFLEQELNGAALIRGKSGQPYALDQINITNYMKYKYSNPPLFIKEKYIGSKIYTFETLSFMDDSIGVYELYNGERTNGIRKVEDTPKEITNLIHQSAQFLTDEVLEDGKFKYGYFPCYGKPIQTYNILRHCSTLYAMSEAYEFTKDEKLLQAIERGINYFIDHATVYNDDRAYVVDYANDNEIKLGSIAHAILALTKYMQATGSREYIDLARQLGHTIIWMQQENGGFVHVWNLTDFTIKEAFRTVYYDGEAVFALLRLYELDPQDIWLEKSVFAFDFLIENDYWKYHDHWLSYAVNEIVTYKPEDQYFIFGLKNCYNRLPFIYQRETTYPTFLELTMAAFKMVRKIEQLNKEYLFEGFDKEFLFETIDHRAEYQRVGYCYPEIAMYFKNPALVLHGFFIRHQAFRVRIDDIEHNLSGYIHYVLYRVPELQNKQLVLNDI